MDWISTENGRVPGRNSRRLYDSIIICTGYRHCIPFLLENLRLVATNRPYPANLYKGIFQDQPNLLYLSMQNVIFTPIISSAQAQRTLVMLFSVESSCRIWKNVKIIWKTGFLMSHIIMIIWDVFSFKWITSIIFSPKLTFFQLIWTMDLLISWMNM